MAEKLNFSSCFISVDLSILKGYHQVDKKSIFNTALISGLVIGESHFYAVEFRMRW